MWVTDVGEITREEALEAEVNRLKAEVNRLKAKLKIYDENTEIVMARLDVYTTAEENRMALEKKTVKEYNDQCEMLRFMKNELVTIYNNLDTQVNKLEAQKKAQKAQINTHQQVIDTLHTQVNEANTLANTLVNTQKAQKILNDELTEQNRLLTKQLNHANKQITAQITAQNTAQNEQDTKDIPRARFGTRNCLLNMFDSLQSQ